MSNLIQSDFLRTPHTLRKILVGFVQLCERYYGKGVNF